ncbi:PQQ-binding-like beta-propeller repeat protein [Armatimonas sp.]|uniref:PQQ-binding-like beta-propeller repeat protein n=1 Tax=Armatimonas sp. TaxID=1872638 RepID=UPI003751A84F
MNIRGIALVALALTAVGTMAKADDWAQWRGPKRDGISQEKGLLKAWPASGPKLLWQVKDIGSGYSTPVVVGTRLYVLSNEGLENEFVRAYSTTNGKLIWSTRLGAVGNPKQQPSYPGARSTATVDGKLLYALGSDGDLACVEIATGKILWTKSLRNDFGGAPGVWAYSESPLVDGNKVIVTPGGENATLVALDKKTGATLWKSAIPGEKAASYASAIAVEIGGVRQYVQYLSKGVVGVEAATGKLLWRFDKTLDTRFGMHALTPINATNLIYTGAASASGAAKISAAAGSFTADPAYIERKAPNGLGGAVRLGDYLYGTSGPVLLCTEFATGKVRWEERGIGAAAICSADGLLFLHGENGEVALAEVTPEGYKEKGRFAPPAQPDRGQSKAWAHPIIANGRLYIRDLGSLWCYDIKAR